LVLVVKHNEKTQKSNTQTPGNKTADNKNNNKIGNNDNNKTTTFKTEYLNNSKQLHRSNENEMIAGVCGGIAEYFNQDPMIVRLLWVLACLASMGTGLLIYAILAIFLPKTENTPINIEEKPPTNTETEPPEDIENE